MREEYQDQTCPYSISPLNHKAWRKKKHERARSERGVWRKKKTLELGKAKAKEEESMPEATIRSKELWRIGGAAKKAYVIPPFHHQ